MTLAPLSASHNISHQLQRRQCEYTNDFNFDGFRCDKLYPTLDQIVARYRDVNRKGKATAANSAWFYSNLARSQAANDLQDMGRTVMAWLFSRGIGSYSIFDGLDMDWHKQQSRYVRDNSQDFIDNYARVGLLSNVEPHNLYLYCYCQGLAAAALNPGKCISEWLGDSSFKLMFEQWLNPIGILDAYLFIRAGTSWHPYSVWATWELPALTRNPYIMNIWRVDPFDCNQDRQLLWSRARGDPLVQGAACPITEGLNNAARNALPGPPGML